VVVADTMAEPVGGAAMGAQCLVSIRESGWICLVSSHDNEDAMGAEASGSLISACAVSGYATRRQPSAAQH
jgi:hypothetical protein